MTRNVEDYLTSLGFIPTESKIYIELLKKREPMTVLELSTHLCMARTTVHENIESLIEKGLAIELRNGSRRKILAEQPFVLHSLIEAKQTTIRKQLHQLEYLQSNLPYYLSALSSVTFKDKK